ncbi:hypothetical protein M758_4G072100 [Ceratodon purpureus]|uniref:F-box domain-containing protein n=1 Tax=Ceratodon purpureus TaxID=3225 RepID=A0A8T0I7Z2_CERPU|nr:hypothetical protein KC19_4G071300 [Ceratodon purpureus]KAG0618539.1 hypothetical protein M758_4G072100 [Ceratodon purpureus]
MASCEEVTRDQANQRETMEEMVTELWEKLPIEMVEHMISFLPVPALYRNRTVCKRWNSIIGSPEFWVLCARSTRKLNGSFIVLRQEDGWSFLNLEERRWYKIDFDERVVYRPLCRIDSMDGDGGLLCHHRARESSIFVTNPIGERFRRLPPCTAPIHDLSVKPIVNIVVDDVVRSFKVLVIANGPEGERIYVDKPRMVIYESTTNKWRNSSDPNVPLKGFPFLATCSIFLNGLLYVLMSPLALPSISEQDCLWSYDHGADVWKNTRVNIHNLRSYLYPQLVMSNGRLFLAAWAQKEDIHDPSDLSFKTWPWMQDNWSYEVIELHLQSRTCSTIFEMTKAIVKQTFIPEGFDIRKVKGTFTMKHMKAFGSYNNAIVLFCMTSGMSIVYDLKTSTWEVLPPRLLPDEETGELGPRVVPAPMDEDVICFAAARPMNLLFPDYTLWAYKQKQ